MTSRVNVLLAGLTALHVIAAATIVTGAGQAPAPGGTNGPTVWQGVFTDAQAERGRGYFAEHCAACHGGDLRGGESKALIEKRFWSDWQETTVDYLFTQISKNMPFTDDGSLAGTLPRGVYVDIVAHILKSNGFPAGTQELTAESARGVRILPKDGTGELPADALAHVVGCLTRSAGGEWQLVKAARPARVLSGVKPLTDVALGDRTFALKFVLTPLQKYMGYRMSATGKLIEDAGKGGLNVSGIAPVSQTCD
jgi:S-disulfanyl-L-cysteine oxidoreductase SoxD